MPCKDRTLLMWMPSRPTSRRSPPTTAPCWTPSSPPISTSSPCTERPDARSPSSSPGSASSGHGSTSCTAPWNSPRSTPDLSPSAASRGSSRVRRAPSRLDARRQPSSVRSVALLPVRIPPSIPGRPIAPRASFPRPRRLHGLRPPGGHPGPRLCLSPLTPRATSPMHIRASRPMTHSSSHACPRPAPPQARARTCQSRPRPRSRAVGLRTAIVRRSAWSKSASRPNGSAPRRVRPGPVPSLPIGHPAV